MDMFDEIANQLKANSKEENKDIPWTFENIEKHENIINKIDAKKYAKYGLVLLFAIVIGISVFNYFSNKESVNVSTTEESNESLNKQIQVHITGEVNNPGLYKLNSDVRIWDAIQAAGGFTNNADQSSLNLAKTLEDGEQLLVAAKNNSSQANNASSQTNNGSSQTQTDGKININNADIQQLQTLSGVGPSTAQKIVDYRTSNGKFKNIEDIKKVSGIGDKTYLKFKDKICV